MPKCLHLINRCRCSTIYMQRRKCRSEHISAMSLRMELTLSCPSSSRFSIILGPDREIVTRRTSKSIDRNSNRRVRNRCWEIHAQTQHQICIAERVQCTPNAVRPAISQRAWNRVCCSRIIWTLAHKLSARATLRNILIDTKRERRQQKLYPYIIHTTIHMYNYNTHVAFGPAGVAVAT